MSDRPFLRLTGRQVKFIRQIIGDSQASFADKLDVSQPAIARFETKKLDEDISGPESILIRQMAEQGGIPIPEKDEPWEAYELRAKKMTEAAATAAADKKTEAAALRAERAKSKTVHENLS